MALSRLTVRRGTDGCYLALWEDPRVRLGPLADDQESFSMQMI